MDLRFWRHRAGGERSVPDDGENSEQGVLMLWDASLHRVTRLGSNREYSHSALGTLPGELDYRTQSL
jgi:hypothetical protein